MDLSIVEGFSKSLAMTVLSEIGDKTFFAAAILAMRHPRRIVLLGCLAALTVMTALSVLVGWAVPNLVPDFWFKVYDARGSSFPVKLDGKMRNQVGSRLA